MPSPNPIVLPPLRGEPPYARYLDALAAEARRRGHAAPGRTALVELALATLGRGWGIAAPRRVAPVGTNRFGEPKAAPPGGD